MTLDEYESIPNAMRLQMAMALIHGAQQHAGHECGTDVVMAGIAAFILDDYIERMESGRGLDLMTDFAEGAEAFAGIISTLELRRMH